MKRSIRFSRLILLAILFSAWPLAINARSYSSGGHSYSSHSSSSSHSASFSHSSSSSHSFSSGSSSSSSSHGSSPGNSSRKFSSGGGKSYSSGSSSDDSSRHSYSSGKSYSSGSSFAATSKRGADPSNSGSSGSSSDSFTFDNAAARARKEAASKDTYTRYNDSQKPPQIRTASPAVPPVIPRSSSTRAYRDTTYIPDAATLSTRGVRVQNIFQSYYARPIVRYHDPYSSLFWWWLLDQSAENRAMWAYQHRADMDAERYQALRDQDAQLETRVEQLEAQQTPVDPAYVPAGLDRDLMYTDEHLQHTYQIRPTTQGSVTFAIFGWILIAGILYCFVWLVFIHRWKANPQP